MKLYCWRGRTRNFGDELNLLLWPRLLPGLLDDDDATLFLGIGSVLDARHAPAPVKVVAGAGFGGYQPPPALDENWLVHWVRGPHTARRLGLPASYGLGDPAVLVPQIDQTPNAPCRIGFMPHFESLERGAWPEAAAIAGIDLIDPRGDPAEIIPAIRRCRLLLSEAMHGAIVADALRVPWVALRPLVGVHRNKWHDWADALDIRLAFRPLAASSLRELLLASRPGRMHSARRLLHLATPVMERVGCRHFAERAARSLASAAAAPPQLSAAAALDRCQTRMLERLEALRRDPLNAALALHPSRNSAYHPGMRD